MRIECRLDAPCDARQRLGFRWDDMHGGAQRLGRAHEHPGAARRPGGGPNRGMCPGVVGARDPYQPAAPVEEAGRAESIGHRAEHGGTGRRPHRHAPDCIGLPCGERCEVADGAPDLTGRSMIEYLRPGMVQGLSQLRSPIGHGRREILDARQGGEQPGPASAGMRAAASAGSHAAADTPNGEPSAADSAATPAVASRPGMTTVPTASGAGSTFSVTSVITPSVPWLPASSLHRSRPVTFFRTRPPERMTAPRPVTTRMPSR